MQTSAIFRRPKIANTRLHQHLCLQAHKDQLEYDVAKSSLGKWLRAVNSHMLLRRLVLSTGLSPVLPCVFLSFPLFPL